ncbi:MAG: adenine phosphoribosyltransferase [Firmicutes bacterium]|nr:adenine phosphoribosyltransferase [Bacillota bacterium]
MERIRTIPDYPVPGVLFRDLTPLWKDPAAFAAAQSQLVERVRGLDFDLVAAVEARGFIFAAPLALSLGRGFVPLRKPGKLPADVVEVEYELEYGVGRLQMHRDAVSPGQRVLVVDDLLATGGTSLGCARLIEQLGGEVAAFAYVVELGSLGGRARLRDYRVESLVVL